ncbi:MAG: 2-oxo acid dehydrogenase subunit E2 [Anaerolineales bacterium]|jgi:pyruvate dehydrogenase E2 component (dihydrolipoamide acetyltransferase)|nr:2-oxo acid dehydrogenase subunit E2 [Anaerolineales bacterium]
MAETVTMPKLGFDMAEGTLVRWVIQEGENVAKGKVLAEIETDKATVEVESNFDGILARHLVAAGDIVPVNTPIAIVTAPGEALPEAAAPKAEAAPAPKAELSSASPVAALLETAATETGLPGMVKASPLARRMARDLKIDLAALKGSGPGGRIVRQDIDQFLAAPPAPASAPASAAQPALAPVAPKAAPLPPLAPLSIQPAPADEVIPLNRLRAAIGRRMVEAKQQVPHFYVTHEYDMAAVMELRKQLNGMLPENEKLSVNDFILKATALALRQFPNLNASLKGEEIVRHGQVNVGVAVAVEGGLLTVVNRDTDRKSLRQVALEVRGLVARAREMKVRPDDIEGSTFSISNLGMFDVEHFIAIINPPEAAILAVGSVREVPVVKSGALAIGLRMKATISVDHRVSDGVEAAQFMQALALYLEDPLRLML